MKLRIRQWHFLAPFLILFSTHLLARQTNSTEVLAVASRFLDFQNALRETSFQDALSIQKINVLELKNCRINIVHLEKPGFIVMSNDTRLPPVMAYSFQHAWDEDTSASNILFQMIKKDLESRIEMLHQHRMESIPKDALGWQAELSGTVATDSSHYFAQWPPTGTTQTEGWIETTWWQRAPYNDLCPLDPDTAIRCPTGCVATAMAQILNYHQYIGDLHFSEEDGYEKESIMFDQDSARQDFPSFKKLNTLLNDVKYKYQNLLSLNDMDLAALNFACGLAVQMRYNYDASGADGQINNVLKHKTGYFSADVYHRLNNQIKVDLMNGYPAYLTLGKTAGTGHALIIDGYNTNGYYHLNFGRGGINPVNVAWYLLPYNLESFDFISSITTNIHPFPDKEPRLEINHREIDLHSCPVGLMSKTDQISIKNNFSDPIRIDYIHATDPFLVRTESGKFQDMLGAFVIQGGDSLNLFIRYTTRQLGAIQGGLIVSYMNKTKFLYLTLNGYGIHFKSTVVDQSLVSGVWTKSGSPYFVLNDIAVEPSKALRIDPGVEIVFCGDYELRIEGSAQIIAKGTESDSIHFYSYNEDGWSGIRIYNSSYDDTLKYCSIRNMRTRTFSCIMIYDSSPVFDHVIISDNRAYNVVLSFQNSAAKIFHSRIVNNISNRQLLLIDGGTAETGQKQEKISSQTFETSFPAFCNTTIAGNTSLDVGFTIGLSLSSPRFVNVTIANNKISRRGGTFFVQKGNLNFRNSILSTDKTLPGNYLFYSGGEDTLSFEYCNVDTNNGALFQNPQSETVVNWLKGNIYTDPEFVDPGEMNFMLEDDSPCVDSGNPSAQYFDIYNPYRPGFAALPAKGTQRNDMGAYGGGRMDAAGKNMYIPRDFSVLQNFPNPFNAKTTIEFHIPQFDEVRITIYNILGQKIRNLFHQKVEPGMYRIIWDGKDEHGVDVSSGLYFYILKTAQHLTTKKMVLLK